MCLLLCSRQSMLTHSYLDLAQIVALTAGYCWWLFPCLRRLVHKFCNTFAQHLMGSEQRISVGLSKPLAFQYHAASLWLCGVHH